MRLPASAGYLHSNSRLNTAPLGIVLVTLSAPEGTLHSSHRLSNACSKRPEAHPHGCLLQQDACTATTLLSCILQDLVSSRAPA